MLKMMLRFVRDDSGPEMLEWAVVTLVLLVATAFAILDVRSELFRAFDRILQRMAQVPPDSWG
jgi:Flp pilus assembly pilin Flp